MRKFELLYVDKFFEYVLKRKSSSEDLLPVKVCIDITSYSYCAVNIKNCKKGKRIFQLIFWSKIESKVAYYVLFYRPWSFKAKIWAAPCYLFAEKVVRPFEQVTDKQKERKRLKKNKSSHSEIKSLILQKKYYT